MSKRLNPCYYSHAIFAIQSNQKKRYRHPSEFVVVMGTLNRFERQNGTIVAQVSSMAYMNTFSPDTMRDDVGILFLSPSVSLGEGQLAVTPIQLTGDATPPGRVCQIAGWGRTEQVRTYLRTSNDTNHNTKFF